jgi:hypothetical protein
MCCAFCNDAKANTSIDDECTLFCPEMLFHEGTSRTG